MQRPARDAPDPEQERAGDDLFLREAFLELAHGYEPREHVMDDRGGIAVPLVRMSKSL